MICLEVSSSTQGCKIGKAMCYFLYAMNEIKEHCKTFHVPKYMPLNISREVIKARGAYQNHHSNSILYQNSNYNQPINRNCFLTHTTFIYHQSSLL